MQVCTSLQSVMQVINGRLPLLSARPTVTPGTLKRAATSFAAWWTEAQWVWTVCLSCPSFAFKNYVRKWFSSWKVLSENVLFGTVIYLILRISASVNLCIYTVLLTHMYVVFCVTDEGEEGSEDDEGVCWICNFSCYFEALDYVYGHYAFLDSR